jgi:uncharacterized sporulation protein YeaH/YhbH (DUF444 family)
MKQPAKPRAKQPTIKDLAARVRAIEEEQATHKVDLKAVRRELARIVESRQEKPE